MQKKLSEFLHVENIFVFVCLFWGLLLILALPPLHGSDEPEHFFKIWGFTQGTLKYQLKDNWVGINAPKSLVELAGICHHYRWTYKKIPADVKFYMSKIKLNKQDKVFFRYNAPEYTPLSYFPSFLVLWVLKLLNVAPLVMTYLLRVSFLLTYIALGYVALRIIPCKRWMLFLFQTLPVVLGQASIISTDGAFFGILFLFFAYTIKLAFDKNIEKIEKKEICLWGILGIILCMLKYAYLPLLFLYFIIPEKKFPNKGIYYKILSTIITITLVIVMCFICSAVSNVGLRSAFYNINAKTSVIILDILKNPLEFLNAVWYSTLIYFKNNTFYSDIIAMAKLPFFVINTYWFLLLLSVFYRENDEPTINLKVKDFFILIFSVIFTYLIIITSVYIIWQHYPFIRGVFGRYLTPLLLILFLILASTNFNLKNKYVPIIIFFVSQFLLLLNLFDSLIRFC